MVVFAAYVYQEPSVSQFPPSVLEIIASRARANLENVDIAVDEALEGIKQLPEYKQLVEGLLRRGVRDQVYEIRHQDNRRLKNELGVYATQKVSKVAAYSASVAAAHRSVFDHCIDGRTLGSLYGRDIPELINSISRRMRGEQFNVNILLWLKNKVPQDKTVREAVDEDRLAKVYVELRTKDEAK